MTDHSIGFDRTDVWTMEVHADVGPPIGAIAGQFAVVARSQPEAIQAANVHMAWILRNHALPLERRMMQS